ncbi:hypothetical protein CYY_005188 [Polysphondylium violaceum]|uniref:SET domain-containing protein n=1 Tax=Polysphondylium violaceum TaxID=133409 RepID=A0A8J4Q3V6_9MYCE|nr:hypothetical protein CYY_005188 [Polysphondylium violaceum]
MFVTTTKNLVAGDQLFLSYVSKLHAYPKRKEVLSSFSFKCTCRLCILDQTELENNFQERQRLAEKYDPEYYAQAIRGSANTMAQLEKHIQDIKNTYVDPDRPHTMEVFMPLITLASLYANKTSFPEKALKAYLECMRILGFDFDVDEYKSKQSPPLSTESMNFIVQYQGSFDDIHSDIFIHICKHAYSLGYEKLARIALSISRLCAKIFKGLSENEHDKIHIGVGFPKQILLFHDSTQLIDK